MFYNLEKTMIACTEDPSLIFDLIEEGHYEVVDKLLLKRKIDINICDKFGNNVLMSLLKRKEYKIVLKYIKREELNINHQNNDGDTLTHILATIDYKFVRDIIKEIKRKKDFKPNIKNNKQETILDKAIKNNYMYTALKILEDKRFTNIDIVSFRNLYEKFVKSKEYGKYTRFNNLEIIMDSLESKKLLPKVKKVINFFEENRNTIKEDILENNSYKMDKVINSLL